MDSFLEWFSENDNIKDRQIIFPRTPTTNCFSYEFKTEKDVENSLLKNYCTGKQANTLLKYKIIQISILPSKTITATHLDKPLGLFGTS
jgi:hypothetical protein